MLSWFRFITIDPVPLSLKAKAISTLACFAAVLLAGWLTALLTGTPNSPVLVASLGASAVILFFIPNSPLAQPWPLIGGQIISALVGMICALAIPDIVIAGACAAGISVFAMLLLRCLHPPATATALTPVTAGSAVTSLGLSFAVVPVAINVLVLFGLAVVVHRWLLNNTYPVVNKKTDARQSAKQSTAQALPKISVSESDLRQALAHGDKIFRCLSCRFKSTIKHRAIADLSANVWTYHLWRYYGERYSDPRLWFRG
ncbi:HPP family protein [Methylocucumis oryzae]|uniref:HPP family protein n=1 Tax=Methylocucumis oryzae TaxID=1632867 RepID=UPI000D6E5C9A|nr:HPP family protein [Methylocucumis oryzae]